MISIPNETRQWKQANNSDLYGNIHISKNINFDNEGYLKLSNSCRSAMNASIDADFNNPAVILYNEDYSFFTATWDAAFSTNDYVLKDYPTKIATAGVPSTDLQTDAVLFGGLMPVSQDTDLDYYDLTANTWTDTDIVLTSSGQHPIENFLSYPALAVANVNTVGLYAQPLDATPTLITTLTILADFEITSIKYHNQNLYVATRHKYGGHAFMYVWNGQGTAAQQAYEVDSNIIFSLCVHQGTVWGLSGQGALLRFNGGGFDMMDALPIYYQDLALTDYSNVSLYKNIMKSNGDVLYIMVSNRENATQQMLNQPDGIWCYDEKVGLYHRYSLSSALVTKQTINTTAVNTTTNEITVSSPAYVTGTEVYYTADSSTVIAGLTDETKYFVIKVDATHIKLATTKALATAGTAIDLTGTGNNAQKLIFFPNIDFGQFFNYRTMSLCVIDRATNQPQYGTDIIYGAETYQRTLTGDDATLGTTTGYVEARGYFITPKIISNEVTDTFKHFTLKYFPLKSELDKIIVKYRTIEDGLETIDMSSTANWRGTWTSTNTFTTTQTEWANAVAGDEIEVLRGAGGGLLAHITSITSDSGTYTVTIDETYDQYLTGDICTVVFRNWKKFATIDINTPDDFISLNLDTKGKFIQFKVELRGLGVKIEEMKIDNKFLLPASR